jgi:hypothetical protein
MTDLRITPNRRNEQALVHALTPAGDEWLHEAIFMTADDAGVLVSLDGALEIEREAGRAGLMVESR